MLPGPQPTQPPPACTVSLPGAGPTNPAVQQAPPLTFSQDWDPVAGAPTLLEPGPLPGLPPPPEPSLRARLPPLSVERLENWPPDDRTGSLPLPEEESAGAAA